MKKSEVTHEIFANQKAFSVNVKPNPFTVQSLLYWAITDFLLYAKAWDFSGSHCYS